ncbi:hypothetical protein H7F15_16760 [Pontibacter sp. Tf4]|nr:hypothetical protein [Pontibacter sp. Tf4]
MGLSVVLTSCEKEYDLPMPVPPSTNPPKQPPVGTPPNTTPPNTTPPTNTLPPVTANSLLKGMGTRTFTWDTQGRLSGIGYTDLTYQGYTIVYEGNKPVRLNYVSGNNWLEYTYEGDKVVAATRYYGEGLVNYRYTFEYEGDKLVKQTTMSYATSNTGRLGVTEYSYDTNGNLTTSAVSWSTSDREEDLSAPTYIRWGGYDSNPNPLPFAYSDFYLPGVKLFVNNPGYRDAGQGKEYYSYSYHASGMPQLRVTTLEAYPNAQPFREQFTY